jgi:hypothetical protein
MGDMYGYTMQELRAAMMAQMPLDVRKAMAARYALALLTDEVFWYGHADLTATQSATGLDAGAQGVASSASRTCRTRRRSRRRPAARARSCGVARPRTRSSPTCTGS